LDLRWTLQGGNFIDGILNAMTDVIRDKVKQTEPSDAELEAVQFGVDINLIECNLLLSHEERILQHEAALDLVQELLIAREARYPRS